MNQSQNGGAQGALIALQGTNMAVVPPKYQWVVALAVTIAQAAISFFASRYNPDGTPASVAYRKPDGE